MSALTSTASGYCMCQQISMQIAQSWIHQPVLVCACQPGVLVKSQLWLSAQRMYTADVHNARSSETVAGVRALTSASLLIWGRQGGTCMGHSDTSCHPALDVHSPACSPLPTSSLPHGSMTDTFEHQQECEGLKVQRSRGVSQFNFKQTCMLH